MARGIFGRAFDKLKSIFVPEPPPKPAPKKAPTTRPVRPQKSAQEVKAREELAKAVKAERKTQKEKRDKLYEKLHDLYGDREDNYGNPSFDRNNVKRRVRNMPDPLVDRLLNLTTTDAIDIAYANSQTEFSGYDQPQGFWYH